MADAEWVCYLVFFTASRGGGVDVFNTLPTFVMTLPLRQRLEILLKSSFT